MRRQHRDPMHPSERAVFALAEPRGGRPDGCTVFVACNEDPFSVHTRIGTKRGLEERLGYYVVPVRSGLNGGPSTDVLTVARLKRVGRRKQARLATKWTGHHDDVLVLLDRAH